MDNDDLERTVDSRSQPGQVPSAYWKKPALLAFLAAVVVLAMLLWPQFQEMQATKSSESSQMTVDQWVGKIRALLDQIDHAGAEKQIQQFRSVYPDYDIEAALFSANTVNY